MVQIDVNGLSVAYERAGHGPHLVLLHGFSHDSRVWMPQLHGLADEFTTIAWDAPGAGRSSDPPNDLGIGDWADCLAEFLRTLAVEQLAGIMSEFHPNGFKLMAAASALTDTRDLLPQIGVPTLLVWGEADVRSPVIIAHQLRDAIPGAKLVVIPGAGHVSNLEQPVRFNTEIRAFCRHVAT